MQTIVTATIWKLLEKYPEMFNEEVIRNLDNKEMWMNKRMLGHLQRLLLAEDEAMERFGLLMLGWLDRYKYHQEIFRILWGEGVDTVMAWTLSPFLWQLGVGEQRWRSWVETGKAYLNGYCSLRGVYELGVGRPFVIPDQIDLVMRAKRNGAIAIAEHPNYRVAKKIARELVEKGFV